MPYFFAFKIFKVTFKQGASWVLSSHLACFNSEALKAKKNIWRQNSQKSVGRRNWSSPGEEGWGQETSPGLLCHQLLIPRFRKSFPLLEPFPTLAFCFSCVGSNSPLTLWTWVGVEGKMEEGLYVGVALSTGKVGGGSRKWGHSDVLIFCYIKSWYFISYTIHQGLRREIFLFLFQKRRLRLTFELGTTWELSHS